MSNRPPVVGWIPNNTTGISAPSGGKLAVGWVSAEKPPFQFMNWFFNLVSQWIYLLNLTNFDVVVGSTAGCTHGTLAAAVADGALGANLRVLLTENYAVASAIALTKVGWIISGLPGVTYSKSGGNTTGFSAQAARVEFRSLRLSGWSTAGDKAISGNVSWTYGRVLFCNFSNCDTEVDGSNSPAGKLPIPLGNITE